MENYTLTDFFNNVLSVIIILALIQFTFGLKNVWLLGKHLLGLNKSPDRFDYHPHCQDPKLLNLIELFKKKAFTEVEKTLLSFTPDYRDFGLKALGACADEATVQLWLKQDTVGDLPRLIHAHYEILTAGAIRGSGTIDTVSKKSIKLVIKHLQEAHESLKVAKLKDSAFNIDKEVALLEVYKGLNPSNREVIRDAFESGLSLDPNHVGLHINYFDAISEKWGGTKEEMDSYLAQMPQSPKILVQCIQAMRYFDALFFDEKTDDATKREIKKFIESVAIDTRETDLNRFNLYASAYWICLVAFKDSKDKIYQKLKPYCTDNSAD